MEGFLAMPITWAIIVLTSITSIIAFPPNVDSINSIRRPEWYDRFKFNAYAIVKDKQIYRLFSHGLIHANWMHLFFNMLTLYFFGALVEGRFKLMFPEFGGLVYLAFYILGFAISSLVDLIKYKDVSYYNAVGASGSVSAIVFAAILFRPDMRIMFIYLPIRITAWIFGILYIAYSVYMSRRQMDNIGHTSHYTGALYGFIAPVLLDPQLIAVFFQNIF